MLHSICRHVHDLFFFIGLKIIKFLPLHKNLIKFQLEIEIGNSNWKILDYDPYLITLILFGWFIISASSFRYFIRVLNYEATDSKTIMMNSEKQ